MAATVNAAEVMFQLDSCGNDLYCSGSKPNAVN